MNLKLRTLGARLTLFLGILLSVFIALLAYLLTVNHGKELQREMTFGTHRLAETVERSVSYYMLNHRQQEIQRTLGAIGKQKGIAKIRMINQLGIVMYSSDKRELGVAIDKGAVECQQCHSSDVPLEGLVPPYGSRVSYDEQGERVLSVMNVISNHEACWNAPCHAHPEDQRVLGLLDIDISLGEMDQRLARSTVIPVVIGVVLVLGICSLVSLLVYRLFGRPINLLLEGVQKVAAGDFYHQIPVARSDEIGQLTRAYNDMTQKLSSHEQKLTETREQLFHSEKLASLGKMAAGVAHQLNSPLTVILNDSSLLLCDAPPESEERKNLEVIVSETKRCGEIIHNLLEFTRFEKPAKKPVGINDIVLETLKLVRHQAVLQDIDVALDLAPDLPCLSIDANQMKQVFLDLITNAVHAMPDGGSLNISSGFSQATDTIVVDFKDNGCGIAENNLGKIFEPFFTTKDAKNGTGLGLAICYEIVQKHGGNIEVRSKVGVGSTFSVGLPAGDLGE